MIIANDDFLAKNPDTAKAFLAAVAKGYGYAIEDPAGAADLMLQTNPELDKKLVKASQKYLAKEYQAEAEEWGAIDTDRWNNFYNWLNENKLVEEDIPENTGFTNEFLPGPSIYR